MFGSSLNSYLEALIPNGMVFGRDQSPLSLHHVRTQQEGNKRPTSQEEAACLSWYLNLGPPSL